VQCAKCHRIEGQGGDAGPDFTRLASNVEPRYIVQSLVQPNVFLAEGYGEMTVRLADGSLVTGRLKQNRPEGLELILVEGSKVILPHDEIEARTELHSSMPAMDKLLTLREMRDVVAFLMTRK
jgi:putative heme-binding domain-containing protein